ncbi:MAG: trypsin-like peptidase domain-containing protein [Coleofasciculus sp. S288]|nr:trypsin-like peptidase domain-containing protein [Coleofasciculus sp. S288]
MSTKRLRIATSGIIAAAAALGATTFDTIAPIRFANLSIQPNSAFAQDVDEQVNIRVYQRASPAVVSIDAGDGTGSGSIISPDGLVLTNAHVVAGSRTVKVTLADGREFQAEVMGFGEEGLDLAVLKIQGQNNLPTITLARNSVQVGQKAFAIGNPFGRFQGTFTTGIVSRIDQERGLIQTDAAINPGNSGGPLLNSNGELIGVNTAIFSSGPTAGNIGIGFAIALDRVQPFLTAVREGRAPRTAQRQGPVPGNVPPKLLALNGSPVTGRLGRGSNVLPVDNSFFDLYSFEGKAGQRVQIDMTSREVDAYLILIDPSGNEVAQDDDGGGQTNARIVATLPVDGTYLLMANSYDAGQAGAYSLRAEATAARPETSASRGNFILQEEGILGPGAPVLPTDGSLYRQYRFEGRAGQSVTISLASPDFDTYVALLDSDEQLIAENDDISQSNPNSELTITLPRTGTYSVIVNAYDRTGRGRYRLTVR